MADEDIVGSASIRITPETGDFARDLTTQTNKAVREVERRAQAEARAFQQRERAEIRMGQLQARALRLDAERTAKIEAQGGKVKQAITSVFPALQNTRFAAAAAATAITASFVAITRAGIAARAEFERSQVAFEGILGESDAVRKGIESVGEAVVGLTEDIRFLSIRSGADIGDLSRGTQTLITTLGLSRQGAVALIEDIASAAAASGAALDSIPRAIRAITQISSKGFLSAEELNQIADVLPVVARPKIYEELAKSLKLPIAEIQRLANEGGRITSAQGLPALVRVLQNVAGASDALDRQLETLPGALNVLRQTAKIAQQDAFDGTSDAIGRLVERFGSIEGLRTRFERFFNIFDDLAEVFIDLVSNSAPIIDFFLNLGSAVGTVVNTVGNIANKVISPFSKLVGLLPSFSSDNNDAARAVQAHTDALDELSRKAEIAALVNQDLSEAYDRVNSAIEGLLGAERSLVNARQSTVSAVRSVRDAERDLADLRSERSLLVAQQLIDVEERRVELLEDAEDAARNLEEAEFGLEDARLGVVDADRAVTEAERDLAEAREALNEATQPATERELAAARREVLEAELALQEAIQDRLEAEQALEALERRRRNQGTRLRAIGLDQLRINLANARASAAAARTVPNEEDLRRNLESAIIKEAEAAEQLLETKEELAELERQGLASSEAVVQAIENVTTAELALERAERGVVNASRDLAEAVRDRDSAQRTLNDANNIDAKLAPLLVDQKEELARIDGQIADQQTRIAETQSRVNAARIEERIAIVEQQAALRLLRNDQDAENLNLIDKINLYRDLGFVGPEAIRAIGFELSTLQSQQDASAQQNAILGVQQGLLNPLDPFSFVKSIAEGLQIVAGANGQLQIKAKPGLGNLLNRFRQFEHGGLIDQPTMAMMGERGLRELVLPLTKPKRAIQLAQQHGFLDMLSRSNQALFPSTPIHRPTPAGPTLSRTVGSGTHDPLLTEIRTLNSLLAQGNLGGDDVDININAPLDDNARLRARQMARQVEKAIKRAKHGR